MKKPDKLLGFINYNDIEHPFEFNEKSFTITLYPPTKAVWNEYSDPMKLFDSFTQDTKKHEWIAIKEITGITSEENHIIFNIQDALSNRNGFISFDVNWYICHMDSMAIDKVDGFMISGHDVDIFYPPNIVLETRLEFNNNGKGLEKISVSSKKQMYESCGKYRVKKNIDAKIKVLAYPNCHQSAWTSPIESISTMITTFSTPVGINTIIDGYNNLLRFFEYITYRKNVDIGDLHLFHINEEGLRDYSGIIVFPNKNIQESHKNVKERIIPYRILRHHTSRLFTAIKNNEIGFQHLSDSIDNMRRFPASRIIMILAEFEREFRNLYGQDSGRSDEYLEVKSEIILLIERYYESKQGKKRQYPKQLRKYVENRDCSFEANIQSALSKCEEILVSFVTRKYPGTYSEIIQGISFRMGEVRNGIAHSRLDFNFDAIHLTDIRVIEELTYAIRLSNMSMSVSDCQRAISQLFGENFMF